MRPIPGRPLVWAATAYYFMYFSRISGSGWLIAAALLAGGLWLGWVGGEATGSVQTEGPARDRFHPASVMGEWE